MTGVRFFHAQNRASGWLATNAVWQNPGGAEWTVAESGMLLSGNSSTGSVVGLSSTRVAIGRWFIQLQVPTTPSNSVLGIVRTASFLSTYAILYPGFGTDNSVGLAGFNGMIIQNGSSQNFNGVDTSGNVVWVANDVITIMLDADASTVRFRRNAGAWSQIRTITGSGGGFQFALGKDGGGRTPSARILQPNSAAWVAPDATLSGYSYWSPTISPLALPFPSSGRFVSGASSFVNGNNIVVTASHEQASLEGWRAFSGSGVWATSTAAVNKVLTIDLAQAITSTGYTIQNGGSANAANLYSPKSWTFAGSNDNSNWTTLHTVSNSTSQVANEVRSFSFSNTVAYRYYRWTFTEANDANYPQYVVTQQITLT